MTTSRTTLRNTLKSTRKNISADAQAQCVEKILNFILSLPEWQTAQYIAVYSPVENEVLTSPLVEKIWQQGKHAYLPVIQSDQSLRFAAYDPDSQLNKNRFGILEPDSSYFFPVEELDIIIMPLVGFDGQGHRLGTGAGYYDRTLAFLNVTLRPKKPLLVGLAYELQKVDVIEAQEWDVKLDKIITEEKIYL